MIDVVYKNYYGEYFLTKYHAILEEKIASSRLGATKHYFINYSDFSWIRTRRLFYGAHTSELFFLNNTMTRFNTFAFLSLL